MSKLYLVFGGLAVASTGTGLGVYYGTKDYEVEKKVVVLEPVDGTNVVNMP